MTAANEPRPERIRAAQRRKRGKGSPGTPRRYRPEVAMTITITAGSEPTATSPADPQSAPPLNAPAWVLYGGVRVSPWTTALLRRRDQEQQ